MIYQELKDRIKNLNAVYGTQLEVSHELGESNMPKRYRDFCLRVIDSERLTPTVELERFKPLTVREYTRDLCGRTFFISECPKCGCGLDGNQVQKYCHECGQRLEWEE